MPRKKEPTSKEYAKVSAIIRGVGAISRATKDKMEDPNNIDKTIDLLVNRRFKKIKELYGMPAITALLNFHIEKEEYEECHQIKKATD